MRLPACLAVLLLFVGLSAAETHYLYPTNTTWVATIQAMTAGDIAILAPGEYTVNGAFSLDFAGSSGSPITVKGTVVDGNLQSIIKQEDNNQNIMNVAGSYYGFYNLTFTCADSCLQGVSVGASSHATFQDLVIHHTNRTGFVASTANAVYTDLTVRRVEIYDTGRDTSECFVFGCTSDRCQMHDSMIELNYCHDIVDTMTNYGVGIVVNTGSYKNTIRNNVIFNTNAAGIRLYDDYGRGVNLVEGNAVTKTKGNGIQVSSGAMVRNNVVANVVSFGIAVSSAQLKTANRYHDIQIVHNTVALSGQADLSLPALSGDSFVVANNAFLSSTAAFTVGTQSSSVWLKNAYVAGSLPTGVASSALFQVTADVVGETYYPTNTSALINAGTKSYPTPVTWDYNGTPRSSSTPTVGAYEYTTATNPGLPIGSTIKTPLETYPPDSYNAEPDTDDGDDSGDDDSGNGGNSAAASVQSWISLILA